MKNKNAVAVVLVLLVGVVGIGFFLLSQKSPETAKTVKIIPKETENAIITVTEAGFNPKSVQVQAGKRVIWLNKSGKTISLNSNDHPTHKKYPLLNFGELPNGASAQHVFTKAGTYGYHNHLNPSQKGIVIVK